MSVFKNYENNRKQGGNFLVYCSAYTTTLEAGICGSISTSVLLHMLFQFFKTLLFLSLLFVDQDERHHCPYMEIHGSFTLLSNEYISFPSYQKMQVQKR